jgi:hypothetical protein
MKIIEEITEWDTEYSVPNHVYFVNDSKDKMFAYVAVGSVCVQEFVKPIKFSVSRRKFKEVANTWGYQEPVVAKPAEKTWQVAGSKGAEYVVTNDRGTWSCSCPSAKWQKGECKHVTNLKSNQLSDQVSTKIT